MANTEPSPYTPHPKRIKFLSTVQSLFPEAVELQNLDLSGSLEDFWFKICRIVHLRPEKLAQKVAAHSGMTFLEKVKPERSAVLMVSKNLAEREEILPIEHRDNELMVATCYLSDDKLANDLRFATKSTITFALTTPVELIYATQYAYTQQQKSSKQTGTIDLDEGNETNEHALIKLAKQLLSYCLANDASDLHIQAFLGGGVARARVDGMLRRVTLLPEKVYVSSCRYFKVNGGMDPTNERIPQDGRMTLHHQNKDIDMRLSTLPARGGERLVIRFLDQNRNFTLDDNGFAVKEIQALRRLSHSPSGLFLITGPTGSGKTSTLYALLSELNSVQRSIFTVENPVEYQLPGISQVDINDKAGLTFGAALRSALRQDPDIILVGEIRDRETAEIALQAALTGHFVLSTLHTNDALTAIRSEERRVGKECRRLCRSRWSPYH
jgi:general secretion pathway protein E/type IV pilus assembly protein PilB